MKVVILNKSDSTGGAAVVSRRLMEALRQEGVDARMLVCEKLSDSPFIELAAHPLAIKRRFLSERLKIFISNGFNRKTLFKIDTASDGLPLWKHPLVKDADAILINWVNQGMLSLKGFRKILELGKPVVWTMHDMWNLTGICHHAGRCCQYLMECKECPLLKNPRADKNLANKIWRRKDKIYSVAPLMKRMAFVAVSNWLKRKSLESSLLHTKRVEVIPNAFKAAISEMKRKRNDSRIRILFGAARIDDPIKGLDTLREASHVLKREYPALADNIELAFFGNVKEESALEGFALPVVRLGVLHGEGEVAKAYIDSDILVSTSSYETLPGTLVEAQAYGSIPVSFNRGGQADIVSHLLTGFIAEYDEDLQIRASNLAQGIVWACSILQQPHRHSDMLIKMKENVETKFSYKNIAQNYLGLIASL